MAKSELWKAEPTTKSWTNIAETGASKGYSAVYQTLIEASLESSPARALALAYMQATETLLSDCDGSATAIYEFKERLEQKMLGMDDKKALTMIYQFVQQTLLPHCLEIRQRKATSLAKPMDVLQAFTDVTHSLVQQHEKLRPTVETCLQQQPNDEHAQRLLTELQNASSDQSSNRPHG